MGILIKNKKIFLFLIIPLFLIGLIYNVFAQDEESPEVVSAQTTSTTTIEIEFNENIDAAAISIEDFFVGDDSEDFTITNISVNGSIIIITVDPEMTTDAGIDTGLFVDFTVQDLAGNGLFDTAYVEDGVAPALIDNEPVANALMNQTPQFIKILFSEDLNSFEMILNGEMVDATVSSSELVFDDLDVLGALEIDEHEVRVTVSDNNENEVEIEFNFTILPTDTPITSSTITGPEENFLFNATENADTLLIFNTSGSTDVFVAPVNESAANIGVISLGKFTEITVSNPSTVIFPVIIEISYTDAEVASAGVLESSLGIYFFNETSGSWQLEPTSSVDAINNIVSASLDHLSTYAVYGSSTPTITATTTGAGGGGGAVFTPTPIIITLTEQPFAYPDCKTNADCNAEGICQYVVGKYYQQCIATTAPTLTIEVPAEGVTGPTGAATTPITGAAVRDLLKTTTGQGVLIILGILVLGIISYFYIFKKK